MKENMRNKKTTILNGEIDENNSQWLSRLILDSFVLNEWKRMLSDNGIIKSNRVGKKDLESYLQNNVPEYLTYEQLVELFQREDISSEIARNLRKYRIGTTTKYRLEDVKEYLLALIFV